MLVYACSDLIFATQVRAAAESLGIPSRPTRDPEALQKRLDRIDDGKLNEPVTAAIIDLDLGELALGMIEQLRQWNERLPIVAFGPHVATDLLHAARAKGADFVMPRSQFAANLPQILERLRG